MKWMDRLNRLHELLVPLLEGEADAERAAALNELLASDPESVEQYLEAIHLYAHMHTAGSTSLVDVPPEDSAGLDDTWRLLAEVEKTADQVAVEKAVPTPEPGPRPTVVIHPRPSRGLLRATAAALVATMMFAVFVYFHPRLVHTPVGVLTESIGAQWSPQGPAPQPGQSVRTNTGPLHLEKGLVTVQFNYGATVVIEGPAVFDVLDEERMTLSRGRCFVQVPTYAIGFTVVTPSSRVIDLGTEFGVRVDDRGSTELHMIRGKASLAAGQGGQIVSAQVVGAGQAKKVEAGNGRVHDIQIDTLGFVRQIDSETGFVWRGQSVLDLAGIVGGGNGLEPEQLGRGINPVTGRTQGFGVCARRQGNGQYVPVPENPFVDGVFVPDGGAGPVQVSSRPHFYDACPDTCNTYYTDIVNGGQIRNLNPETAGALYCPLELGGRLYGVQDRPALVMHANLGITFDLDAIRRFIAGRRITRFRSLCGIAQKAPTAGGNADFHVLVDGQLRFHRQNIKRGDAPVMIDVELRDTDRFLTLIATDAGLGASPADFGDDYSFFAEPVLVME